MRFIYLAYIVPASIIIPLIAGWWRYRRLPGYARIILVYLVIAGIVNFLASAMAARHINNMPLLHIYTLVEFVLLALFYRMILEGHIKKFIPWLIGGFILLCILYATYLGNVKAPNTVPRSLESFIIGAFAVIFFFNQMPNDLKNVESLIFFNAGLLLYFSGAFLLFLFTEVLMRDKPANNLAWIMHATLVLMMYLLFAAAFIRTKKI